MKLLYSAPHLITLTMLQDFLQSNGIECAIMQEQSGALRPEGAITGTLPELWIADDSRLEQAQKLVADWLHADTENKEQPGN